MNSLIVFSIFIIILLLVLYGHFTLYKEHMRQTSQSSTATTGIEQNWANSQPYMYKNGNALTPSY